MSVGILVQVQPTATMQTTHLLLTLLLAATVTLRSNAWNLLLDFDGEAVEPGVKYYMVSSIRGAGGGGVLPVEFPRGSSCASYVGWAKFDVDRGVPVIINSVNSPNAKSIRVGEIVYIQFSKVDSCVKTPFWTLAGMTFVATGGSMPVVPPPVGTSDNFFSFRNGGGSSSTYGLSYCPCNLCLLACFNVGRSSVNGQRILVRGAQSDFTFALVKADRTASTEPFPSSLLRTPTDSDNYSTSEPRAPVVLHANKKDITRLL